MDKTTKIVRDYYDAAVQEEWDRLARHRAEFAVNCHFMDRYIRLGQRVLDIGGGPGRYSLYLSHRGCDVTLLDLSEENAAFAKQKAGEAALPLRTLSGDARDADQILGGETGTFDHVLLMGPLYHLLEESERVKAIQAALRMLKPDGCLFSAFISSYAGVIYAMKYAPELILDKEAASDYDQFVRDQPFTGDSFTQAYFIRHADILPFMKRFPLQTLHLLGSEGILSPCEPIISAQPPEVFEKWLELAIQVCEREDLLSYSEHFLHIGRKIQEC